MILLTGATGTTGTALLRRLTADRVPVRCLVRDPRRLGAERVRVQIALGDLADPATFRNCARGVDTVVHLAASTRDQPAGSLEEVNAVATLRLVRAAERAGARRFVLFSSLGASEQSPSRFLRSKALARRAVEQSSLETTVFSPSMLYAPGSGWLARVDRLSHLPLVPMARPKALSQPIWAQDAADCVLAAIGRDGPQRRSFDLAGPERMTRADVTRAALDAAGRPRRLVALPAATVRLPLRATGWVLGDAASPRWDELALAGEDLVTERGTADAETLGVAPLRLRTVLGGAPSAGPR